MLDLLNVRYVIIPRQPPLEPMDAATIERFSETVYTDANVEIRANPSALPRAWIVHTAVQATASAALDKIATGQVDARQTAILEDTPPSLAPARDPRRDRATVTLDQPDHLSITTATDAPGLLMLSEIDYPAWNAYVDGTPARVFVADGALRAVPVSAGDHTVELRFESAALSVGMGISVLALIVLAVMATLPLLFARSVGRPRPDRNIKEEDRAIAGCGRS